ncbi:glycosyltransferase family 4 protein [Dyadobacter aurulentus]|uniref:glycosyltransferase family 4 protein n=1 Tax=Dyadobacter sp. UC 10 TaxID=2605428 RepID=UPI0011F0EE22|nr:glycosyltransferase family 4 protein [Dyadobacter sp. UC 10]KAA0990383.1 glycosyltransferase family 4 protein [Dyadobacter sp. UC 10]
MHILLIHQFFLKDHEGGGARWNEMTRAWINSGHEVTVLAGNVHYMSDFKAGKKPWFEEYTSSGGAKVIRCLVSRNYHSGFLGRLWGYFSFVFSALFAGIFYVRGTCDVVIVTSPPLFVGLAGWFISFVKNIPFVFEVRDLWPESAVETGVLKNRILIKLSLWLEGFLYRNAELITVLTPAFKKHLIRFKQISSEKIIVIPNAADSRLADFVMGTINRSAFRKKLGWEGRFVLIYAGAHGVANCLTQIVGAAVLLSDTNAHFVLIGDGPEKAELINMANALELSNLTFMNPIPKEEVLKYIWASDAGMSVLKKADIFKTIYSNKTFDYFSCKKPVMLAIDGASRDLVEYAQAGIYIEPENALDFANKVRQYLNDPDLAIRHGENGHLFVREHFDREKLAEEYLRQINAILLNTRSH